jgi:flagellar hook protein FlgE
VEISNLALQGMARATSMVDRAAGRIARLPMDASATPTDTVDLSTEMVNLLQGQRSFEANVKSAQTADEMTRTTLDMLA